MQRLAELILYPRKHYRFLPPYLAALDRVVSVSSPASDFPLPQLQLDESDNGFLTNGETSYNGFVGQEGLGSDASLGGALLTPIPWLRRESTLANAVSAAQRQDAELKSEGSETIEGPNGAGRIETVSVTVNGVSSAGQSPISGTPEGTTGSEETAGMTTEQVLRAEGAVTQGELLRQEQEAGVVPVIQPALRRQLISPGSGAAGRDPHLPSVDQAAKSEEHLHARGPDVIGMEDMGPQDGGLGASRPLDLDAAAGRPKSPQPPDEAEDTKGKQTVANEKPEGDDIIGETEQKDYEGDIVVTDVEQIKADIKSETQADTDELMPDAQGETTEDMKR